MCVGIPSVGRGACHGDRDCGGHTDTLSGCTLQVESAEATERIEKKGTETPVYKLERFSSFFGWLDFGLYCVENFILKRI